MEEGLTYTLAWLKSPTARGDFTTALVYVLKSSSAKSAEVLYLAEGLLSLSSVQQG